MGFLSGFGPYDFALVGTNDFFLLVVRAGGSGQPIFIYSGSNSSLGMPK
jgi:hypothetical protein